MRTNTLPTHPSIVDPRTGDPLRAVGIVGGRPVWPVMGASDPIPGGSQPAAPSAAPPATGTPTPPAPAPPAAGTPAPGTPPAGPPTTPPAATGGATPPANPADQPLGEAGLRALQAERDRVAQLERDLAASNQKVAEFEQAGMNDLQKAQAKVAELEQKLVTESTERLRLKAATDHGIPATHLHLLTAADEAALKAQAASVQELLTKAGVAATAPAPLPGQGTPATPVTPTLAAGAALYKSPYQNTQNT
ncbi:hypothetical protein F9C11_20530 [Amycolatopsis sp. VS8301801F10]|uniref:hypothetical protein n=1 Tax=Amycolatopsis sp. VS8301801F10 TaxID=2652442 RepID=UPI0038FBFA61